MVVEGLRQYETDLRVVSAEYLQPVGRFHGRVVDREVHDLFGFAEVHRARW